MLAVFLLRLPCDPCCQLSHFVARHTPVFLGSHQLAGHELTARINLLPVKQPDASLEQNIDDIERKRTRDESKVFDQVGVIFVSAQIATSQAMRGQAISEMAGLATIVQNEAEVLWSRKKTCANRL